MHPSVVLLLFPRMLPSDSVQALALLHSVFPTTAPPWISCRNKCAGSGMPVLAVTSTVSGRKPTASCDSPLPAWLFTFSSSKISTSCCVLPWGRPGTNPPCVQGLLSSFPPHPRRQLMQHRLQSGMPLCHLENSCSGQAACSAGLISIGNVLTFVQPYIIDNGEALPRKAQLVVYSGLSVLLCSHCLPHQHLELQLPTPHVELGLHWGSQTALWVVQSWGCELVQNWELGYLSRDVQISWLKHRLSGPSQCLCGIWFQSKLNKNSEITHVRIFHELGAALTPEATDGVCEARSSPGLCPWDSCGTGPEDLECPLLQQLGLTGSSLALLFASLTCGLVQGWVEKTLLPSPWCSTPQRFGGKALPFFPGSQEELKQGRNSSLLMGLAGPSMQIF